MFLDFIKDIFISPDTSFKKLTPDYFLRQRMKMNSQDDYFKWLLKEVTYYTALARMVEEKGRPIPQSWIDGIRLIESERERVVPQVSLKVNSESLPDTGNNRIGMIVTIIIVILFVANFGFRLLKLFSSSMSDKDRAYVESVVPISLSSSEYLKNIDDAYNYQGKKNYNEMLKSAQKALQSAKTDKEKTESHYWVGLSFFKLGDIRNSKSQYNAAIFLDPNYVPALSSLSAVYYVDGKFEEAVKFAKKAISLNSDYAWAHSNLALAYVGVGKLDEAIVEFKTAISLSPEVPDFYLNLASSYVQGGQMNEAIDQYNMAIKMDPKFDKAHYGLALVYGKTGNFEKHESELKLAIEHNVKFSDAYLSLFEYYAYSNRTNDLKDMLIKYLEITGKSKETLKNEINMVEWMKNKEKIFKAIDEIL